MIIGVDYSITSPALTIFRNDKFYCYYRDPKQTDPVFSLRTGYGDIFFNCVADLRLPGYKRYNQLADWFESCMKEHFPLIQEPYKPLIVFEGVSYGSPGRIVQLAENAGVTKSWLTRHYFVDIVDAAPSTVKKFATGHGFATKTQMYEAFVADQGIGLSPIGTDPEKSPLCDIVDSYWLCKYAIHNKEALVQSLDPNVAKANKKKKRRRKKTKSLDS